MHEAVNQNLRQVELTLTKTADESESISTTLAQTVRSVLTPQQGKIRGRSAVTLLSAALTPQHQEADGAAAAVAVATSAELIYIANRMHQAVNILPQENNISHIYVLAADFLFSKATLYISSTGNLRTMEIASRTLMTISESSFAEVLKGNAGSINWQAPFQQCVEKIKERIAGVFAACGESGAVIGSLPERTITQCSNYGLNLGMVQYLQQGIDLLKFMPAITRENIFEEWGVILACMEEYFLNLGDRTHLQTIQTIVEQPTSDGLAELRDLASVYGPLAIPMAEITCKNFNALAKACIPGEAIQTEVGTSMIELVDLAQTGQVI